MATDFKGIVDRRYHVITNGFDEEDFKTEEVALDARFSIAHFGSLGKTRNPEILWQVLSQLKSEIRDFGSNLEIKLVGSVDYQVMESIRKYGLAGNLNRMGYLSHDRMIREMKRSQILLLLINNTPNAKLIATGKLFEYMAARRPVLCIGPEDGDAAGIIRTTNTGEVCGFDTNARLMEIILESYTGFLTSEKKFSTKGIEQYSREYLTRLLGELMGKMKDEE
jgi:glycosyltransferase involved in cell wall biosynthesis